MGYPSWLVVYLTWFYLILYAQLHMKSQFDHSLTACLYCDLFSEMYPF